MAQEYQFLDRCHYDYPGLRFFILFRYFNALVLQLCLATVLRNVELEQRKALLSPRGSHWIIHQNNKPDTGRDSGKNTEQRNSKKHQQYREIDRQRCAALQQWFHCGACRGINPRLPALHTQWIETKSFSVHLQQQKTKSVAAINTILNCEQKPRNI